jgi:aspartate/methionine/tyrosine aminotransferase
MEFSKLIDQIPEYPFAKIGRIASEVEKRDNVQVIRATIGNPDREAPMTLKALMAEYILQPGSTYGYPFDVYPKRGIPELIDAIINDYRQKYGVSLSEENIAVTGWAKEVLHNLVRLFGPGKVRIPDPVYPAYASATTMSGHEIEWVRTSKATGWVPEFSLQAGTTALYFCDPNNHVGSVASIEYYKGLASSMAEQHVAGIFDKAYKDYVFDDSVRPVSITQVPGLLENGFEVYSFSKHYNLVGVGLGWIVSSKENIDTWLRLSSHFTQGVSWYKQKIGVSALTNLAVKAEMKEYFKELHIRQRMLTDGLNSLGLKTQPPAATPYVWVEIPASFPDEQFVIKMIDKSHVAFTPGSYFGANGKGYLRATLFMTRENIEQALERIEKAHFW